jgi:hypothetical protein
MSTRILRVVFGALSLAVAGFALFFIFAACMNGMPGMPHHTSGTVIGYERELTGRSMESLRYLPIVDYPDAGQRGSFRSELGFAQPRYPTGAVVRIVYSPNKNPKLRFAEIVSPATRWAASAWLHWLVTVVAIICIIPCVIAAYASLNGRRIREVISTRRHAPNAG